MVATQNDPILSHALHGVRLRELTVEQRADLFLGIIEVLREQFDHLPGTRPLRSWLNQQYYTVYVDHLNLPDGLEPGTKVRELIGIDFASGPPREDEHNRVMRYVIVTKALKMYRWSGFYVNRGTHFVCQEPSLNPFGRDDLVEMFSHSPVGQVSYLLHDLRGLAARHVEQRRKHLQAAEEFSHQVANIRARIDQD